MRRPGWLSVLIVPAFFSTTGCITEWVIKRKTENAYQNAKPLVSATPLPKNAPPPEPGAFPHNILDGVLARFVNDVGRVDYQSLAKDRRELSLYTAYINAYSPKKNPGIFPSRQDQLAYYINAFNTSVIIQILDRYPVENIYSMRAAFFVETVYVLGGEKYTLHDLETLLRETFKDPRIHFALNCAARGDPRLPRHAFHPETLEQELDDAARSYLSEERNLRLDGEAKILELSMMFDLFEEDFLEYEEGIGNESPSLISYLNRYLPEEKRLPAEIRIKYVPYNWIPNDQAIPE